MLPWRTPKEFIGTFQVPGKLLLTNWRFIPRPEHEEQEGAEGELEGSSALGTNALPVEAVIINLYDSGKSPKTMVQSVLKSCPSCVPKNTVLCNPQKSQPLKSYSGQCQRCVALRPALSPVTN